MMNFQGWKSSLSLMTCCILLLVGPNITGQTVELGVFSSNSYNDRSFDITSDQSGNSFYAAGSVSLGTGSFFIGVNFNLLDDGILEPLQTTQPPLVGNGGRDGYLAKLNNAGDLIWMINFGGAGQDEALAVEIGADGNIYVTGYYYDQAVFASFDNSGPVTLTSEVDSNMDIFLACYSPSGTLLWARDAGGFYDDAAYDMAVLSDGIVIAGTINDGAARFGSIDGNSV